MSPLFDVRFGTKSICHIDSMVGFLDAFISPFASVCMVVGFSPALIPHEGWGCARCTKPPQVEMQVQKFVYPVSKKQEIDILKSRLSGFWRFLG